jgi:hypothetical protein
MDSYFGDFKSTLYTEFFSLFLLYSTSIINRKLDKKYFKLPSTFGNIVKLDTLELNNFDHFIEIGANIDFISKS